MDNECITVVGDGIDSVALTVMLRKKMGYADLISVGSAEEKKEEKKEEGGDKRSSSSVQQMIWPNQVLIARLETLTMILATSRRLERRIDHR